MRIRSVFLTVMTVVALLIFVSACNSARSAGSSSPKTESSPKIETLPKSETSPKRVQKDFPSKPISFILPVSAGGGFDVLARMLAPVWEKYLPNHAKIAVENHPGGDWKIGINKVWKAEPDGHTMGMFMLPGNVTNQIAGKVDYDIRKFKWIGGFSESIYVAVSAKKSAYQNGKDLIQAKEPVKTGVVGLTNGTGLYVVVTADNLKFRSTQIPHDGTNEMLLSLTRGSIDWSIFPYETIKKYIVSKDVTPLWVYANKRLSELPDVPTVLELGGSENLLNLITLKRVISAPPDTPENVLGILRESLKKALSDPKLIEQMKQFDAPANYMEPQDVQKLAETGVEEYKKAIELINKKK